jgi:arylsulfatase
MKASAFLETFMEYPTRQQPDSFSIDNVPKKVEKAIEEYFKKRGQE